MLQLKVLLIRDTTTPMQTRQVMEWKIKKMKHNVSTALASQATSEVTFLEFTSNLLESTLPSHLSPKPNPKYFTAVLTQMFQLISMKEI